MNDKRQYTGGKLKKTSENRKFSFCKLVVVCRTNENTNTPRRLNVYYDTRRHSKGGGGEGACALEGDGDRKTMLVKSTVARWE